MFDFWGRGGHTWLSFSWHSFPLALGPLCTWSTFPSVRLALGHLVLSSKIQMCDFVERMCGDDGPTGPDISWIDLSVKDQNH